ncbi:MAG: SDR family NAD(P)-dependent oxidoreductase [Anaerolineales bacterium]
MKNNSNFCVRYGQWAIVAGASEGLGAEYAKKLASRGLNLILIARRAESLQSLAGKLSDQYHVETKTVALDLSLLDTAGQILEIADGLDIGLLVYNAAFSAVGPFLEKSLDDHLKEIDTNVRAPLKLLYLFGERMVRRGRGGIILMASLSAFQGSAYISTYAATKAFNIVLAEGLWEEWQRYGVDVMVCVAGAIRTPNYIASQPKQTGRFSDAIMEPEPVVHEALAALGKRPYIIPGRMNQFSSFIMRHLLPRKMAVQLMGKILHDMYVH